VKHTNINKISSTKTNIFEWHRLDNNYILLLSLKKHTEMEEKKDLIEGINSRIVSFRGGRNETE